VLFYFIFIILLKRGAMKNREMSGKKKEEPSWLDDDANESHFSSPFFLSFPLYLFISSSLLSWKMDHL